MKVSDGQSASKPEDVAEDIGATVGGVAADHAEDDDASKQWADDAQPWQSGVVVEQDGEAEAREDAEGGKDSGGGADGLEGFGIGAEGIDEVGRGAAEQSPEPSAQRADGFGE